MSCQTLRGVVTGLVVAIYVQTASADLIYDNGPPNRLGGSEMTEFIQADDFVLSVPVTLTDVRFWSLELQGVNPYGGSISWAIYSSVGATPSAVLFSGSAVPTRLGPSSVTIGSDDFDEFQNDFSLGSVALSPGTYWLGLHNGPLTTDTNDGFYWEWTDLNATNTATARGNEDDTPFGDGIWVNNGQEHAFQLTGTPNVSAAVVPEPASLTLFGMGGLGFLLSSWRRKSASVV